MSIKGANRGVSVAAQDIYAASTTQKHRIGERLVLGDRVFRYAKAGAAIEFPYTTRGCFNYNKPYEGVRPSTAYAVGAREIITTAAPDTQGDTYDGVDELAEGYVWFQSDPSQLHRIKSNTAVSSSNITVTLYDGITTALVSSASDNDTLWITMWPNVYSKIYSPFAARAAATESEQYCSVVCLPLIEVAASSYFWGQTWGPAFFTAHSTVPGAAAASRDVYFSNDGAVMDGADRSTDYGRQRAGYVLSNTATAGDQLIMLQLSP